MPSYTGPLSPFDPWTQLLMQGVQTNDSSQQEAIAHYMAQFGAPPGPPPRGPGGFQPVTAPGTTVTPPTRPPGDAGAGATTTQAGLPTGEVGRPPPSTVGNTGSDGGTNEPGPQAPIPMLRPATTTPSPKDNSAAHIPGEAAGLATAPGGGAWGAGAEDTGTANAGDMSGMQKGITDFGKALGGLQPPASQEQKPTFAPLPQHETRFTPVDLMTLIQALSQAGTKTAPQSLGALIGR